MIFFNVEVKYLQKIKTPYKTRATNSLEAWKKRKIIMDLIKRKQGVAMGPLFGEIRKHWSSWLCGLQ